MDQAVATMDKAALIDTSLLDALRAKLKPGIALQDYDGSYDARRWCAQAERVQTANDWSDDLLLTHALGRISGDAGRRIDVLPEIPKTWSVLKTALIDVFSIEKTRPNPVVTLANLQQHGNERASAFFARVRAICIEIHGLDEARYTPIVVQNLVATIRSTVEEAAPRTIKDAEAAAVLAESEAAHGKRKRRRTKRRTPMRPPCARRLFELVAIDVMGPLPGSMPFIVTAVDHATRWAEWMVLSMKTPDKLMQFIERLADRYGYPGTLQSDNVPELAGDVFSRFCEQHSIEQVFTSAHSLKSGKGLLERFNVPFRRVLKGLIDSGGVGTDGWQDRLPAATRAYRFADNLDIGTSPYEALYGMPPKMPEAAVDMLASSASVVSR